MRRRDRGDVSTGERPEAAEAQEPRERGTPIGVWEPRLEHAYQVGVLRFGGESMRSKEHGMALDGIGLPEVDSAIAIAVIQGAPGMTSANLQGPIGIDRASGDIPSGTEEGHGDGGR